MYCTVFSVQDFLWLTVPQDKLFSCVLGVVTKWKPLYPFLSLRVLARGVVKVALDKERSMDFERSFTWQLISDCRLEMSVRRQNELLIIPFHQAKSSLYLKTSHLNHLSEKATWTRFSSRQDHSFSTQRTSNSRNTPLLHWICWSVPIWGIPGWCVQTELRNKLYTANALGS